MVTLDLWQDHVEGKRPLGIIPIREDSTCSWGSIDIDEYDVDALAVVKKIEQMKLPLVPCRSKSGGLHLFLFVTEPVAATWHLDNEITITLDSEVIRIARLGDVALFGDAID